MVGTTKPHARPFLLLAQERSQPPRGKKPSIMPKVLE